MAKIIKADPIYRRWFIALVIVMSSGALVATFFGLFDLSRYFDGLEGRELVERVRLVFVVMLTPLLLIGVYAIRHGLRVIKTQELPPPGTKVVSDTKVQVGKWAVVGGWGAVIIGLCMFPLFYYGAVVVPDQFEELFEERQGDSGEKRSN